MCKIETLHHSCSHHEDDWSRCKDAIATLRPHDDPCPNEVRLVDVRAVWEPCTKFECREAWLKAKWAKEKEEAEEEERKRKLNKRKNAKKYYSSGPVIQEKFGGGGGNMKKKASKASKSKK